MINMKTLATLHAEQMKNFDEEGVNLFICEGCRGEGNWLSECCDGSYNCPCKGQPYFPSKCPQCSGSGKNIKAFLTTSLLSQIDLMIEIVEKKKFVHEEIMRTYESYPLEWHEGNIKVLSDLSTLLSAQRKLIEEQ